MLEMTSDDAFLRNYHDIQRFGGEAISKIEPQDDFHARVVRLRLINDDLLQRLPHTAQLSIHRLLEQKLVATDDLNLLFNMKETFIASSQYRSVDMLAAVKYIHRLYQTSKISDSQIKRLESVTFKPWQEFDHFQLGDLQAHGLTPTQALLERVKYEEHWVGEVGDELYERIAAVIGLLRTASTCDEDMRVLSPIGYFHEPHNRAFGLLFNIPKPPEPQQQQPSEIMTLRLYMERTQKNRPSLEDRWLLAHRLISALARLHRAD